MKTMLGMAVTRKADQSASGSTRNSIRRNATRPRRASRPCNYIESSYSDEGDTASLDGSITYTSICVDPRRSGPSTLTTATGRRARKRNRAVRSFNPPPAKKLELYHSPDDQKPIAATPNWLDPAIPFECWTHIFLYAAGSGSGNILATGWLVQAAITCRAFTEPALNALYRCPPIRHASKAKRLAALLQRPPTETFVNYRTKVESLHVSIHVVPQATLYHLIYPLPRLKELIIYTSMDQPPYRALDTNVRWHYTQDIFSALEAGSGADGPDSWKPFPTVLKSWEWSGRFIGGDVPSIEMMATIHQTVSFSKLTKLSLTNFQVPSLKNLQYDSVIDHNKEERAYYEDGLVIQAVARAISKLSRLSHLVIESSTVMDHRLLPLLPKNLTHLELINCWEVKSEDLTSFLGTHGKNLRTLILLHNQSLNLEFLTSLADSCPDLRELHVSMSYYRHHHCIDDAYPMYDKALLSHQIPKWPSSLRVINIEYVRDWSIETAEMFFRSLINNSANFPSLRHLTIRTTLDIPWQYRATMRQQWRATMEQVFLRPCPSPRLYSTAGQPSMTGGMSRAQKKKSRRLSPPSRRSGRLAGRSDSDSQAFKPVKSLRHRRARPSYKDPDTGTDEDEEDLPDLSEKTDGANSATRKLHDDCSKPFIQGLCDTVNLQLDNQKVRELQYGMEDFLDEDDSGSDLEWIQDEDEEETILLFH